MKKVTNEELERICNVIREYIYNDEKIVIGVSGGIDSDVVARICAKVVPSDRLHLFFVIQEGIPKERIATVRELSEDLGCKLSIIDLSEMNISFIEKVHEADPDNFNMESFMDSHRAKCSLRAAIYSTYQDNDFIFCSTTNRTEMELGTPMLFANMLGHIRPIIHLYKTQVYELAKLVGTRENVLRQIPSADFWEDEDDMDDLSYMLLNRKQVPGYRRFSMEEMEVAGRIKEKLSGYKIDLALEAYSLHKNKREIMEYSGLEEDIVEAIGCLIEGAKKTRARKILVDLEPIN